MKNRCHSTVLKFHTGDVFVLTSRELPGCSRVVVVHGQRRLFRLGCGRGRPHWHQWLRRAWHSRYVEGVHVADYSVDFKGYCEVLFIGYLKFPAFFFSTEFFRFCLTGIFLKKAVKWHRWQNEDFLRVSIIASSYCRVIVGHHSLDLSVKIMVEKLVVVFSNHLEFLYRAGLYLRKWT